MNNHEERIKALETKVKILEEAFQTLKNIQLSDRMEAYVQSTSKTMRFDDLMNTVSDKPELDFSQEAASVSKIETERQRLEQQIVAAKQQEYYFSDDYPSDPRYFNYEIESGKRFMYSRDGQKCLRDFEPLADLVGKGIRITSFNGFDTSQVVIPKEIQGVPVISIGERAFLNSSVKQVILPSTLRAILASAFKGCQQLSHIDLPGGLNHLGTGCFQSSGLNEITIPDELKEIPSSCFRDCRQLTSVSLGKVRHLHHSCFRGCTSLTEIILPDGLVSIDTGVFENTGIQTLILPQSLKKISDRAFGDSYITAKEKDVTCVFLGQDTQVASTSNSVLQRFTFVNLIHCLPGSNIQVYAREHRIPIKPLSEFRME